MKNQPAGSGKQDKAKTVEQQALLNHKSEVFRMVFVSRQTCPEETIFKYLLNS